MGLTHSPQIVRDGLVLYLDAANPKSYPGSGTNVNNLSAPTNNGTLINGVAFSTENGGSFAFDTTNDFISVAGTEALNLINNVTLEAWIKYTTTANTVCIEKSNNNSHYQFQIFSNTQGTGLGGELVFMLQPNPSNWVVAGEANNDSNWHHVVGTYNRSSATAKIYIDGILKNTNSSILNGPTSNAQNLILGSRSGVAGFGGSIALTKIYNRVLNLQEVQQNFNATRGRFGI